MLVGCCIENWCHFPKAIFTQNPSSGSIKRCHYEVLHLNFDVFWNATWWCQAFGTFQCFWILYLLNSSLPEAFLDLIFQILCCSNPTFEFQKVYVFMILVWAGSPYISQLPTSHLECSSWDAKSCGFGSPMTTNPHLARHAWERLPKYSSDMGKPQ